MDEGLEQRHKFRQAQRPKLHPSEENNELGEVVVHVALEEGVGQKISLHLGAFIILQARCGSTRLTNKVLLPLGGVSMVEYLLAKLMQVRNVEGVILATTTAPEDDQLEIVAHNMGIMCVRGSQEDVLSRYIQAIDSVGAVTVIRLTADCPLHSPALIESALELYERYDVEYLSNTIIRTYPRGFDIEICRADALKRIDALLTTTAFEREHVTAALYAHPNQFRCGSFYQEGRDDSAWRLTVDERADYLLIERIAQECAGKEYSLKTLQTILDHHPEWKAINQHIQQK